MRRLFGCPDIVSLTEKFLMARNFFRIFTENNPIMWDSKTFCIPEAKGLSSVENDNTSDRITSEVDLYPYHLKNNVILPVPV